ncbi:hypothetical protein V6N13_034179 [Hibiscus sabdariffa]
MEVKEAITMVKEKEVTTNVEEKEVISKDEGSFEALGEKANHVLDCEKVTVLMTISVTSKISEVAEVEVDNISFVVRVDEKGFIDQPTKILVGVSNLKKTSEKIYHVKYSTATMSLDSSLKSSPANGGFRQEVEDEINVVFMGKVFSDSGGMETCICKNLGEVE